MLHNRVRTVISDGKLFETSLYQWLPAKSTFDTSYIMFLVRTPEGFKGVSTITISNGTIAIQDERSGGSISITASLATE